MERQEILIRFTDLRRLASTVPTYLAQSVGVRTAPPLRAGVEDEFSIIGLDTELLILEFTKTYQVELDSFDFTGLLGTDGPDLKDTLLFLPLATYLVLSWLLKSVAGLLCWPFASSFARRIWQQPVPLSWLPAKLEDRSKVLMYASPFDKPVVGRG